MKHRQQLVPRRKPQPSAPPARRAEYPTPQERERIIEQRDELMLQAIGVLVSTSESTRSQHIEQLMQEYGPQEVALALDKFQKGTAGRDLLTDKPVLYREYRRAFARFGGQRRFLSRPEQEDLGVEYMKLAATRQFKSPGLFIGLPSQSEREWQDLLLHDQRNWDNLFPPDTPPRPANWNSPPAGVYAEPAKILLEWGWDLDNDRIARQAQNTAKWRPTIPELARMALDEGLLEGWPGEPASWAPYHALRMLGHLRAHEQAGPLLALLDRQNDWLSDQLIPVWAQMGLKAAPVLWGYLGDLSRPPKQRGLVLGGLEKLAEAFPDERMEIINELIERLQAAPVDDAKMNAYMVFVLNRMGATQAKAVIEAAFEHGKIDPKIMDKESVDFNW